LKTNRFDYVRYDEHAQKFSERLKALFIDLHDAVDELQPSRELALAVTNLEQAFMWVGKAIRNDQLVRTGSDVEV